MLKAVIAILVAVALAFGLNPNPDSHRAKLKQAVAERSQLAGLLGIGHLAAFASTYHTVGLASYSTVGNKVVTYGAFGMVFVPDLPAQ